MTHQTTSTFDIGTTKAPQSSENFESLDIKCNEYLSHFGTILTFVWDFKQMLDYIVN